MQECPQHLLSQSRKSRPALSRFNILLSQSRRPRHLTAAQVKNILKSCSDFIIFSFPLIKSNNIPKLKVNYYWDIRKWGFIFASQTRAYLNSSDLVLSFFKWDINLPLSVAYLTFLTSLNNGWSNRKMRCHTYILCIYCKECKDWELEP